MKDWPINVYLKRHFSNQRAYQRRQDRKSLKNRAKSLNEIGYNDLSDFGSGVDTPDEDGEEDGDEF